MKTVIQRVKSASLSVDGNVVAQIANGLVVYAGVQKGDTEQQTEWLAKKIANMRVFEDENGKLQFSALTLGYEVLAVSQFTLLAECSHGNRPDFFAAEEPAKANALFEFFVSSLKQQGLKVQQGVFGADMQILQHNDGPVTIVLEK